MNNNLTHSLLKVCLLCMLASISAGSLGAQTTPTINTAGVLNNASFALQGMPNSSIAQGSLFVVFGTNLGPVGLTQQAAYPLQATLAGVSGKVTVGSQTFDLIPAYLTPTQAGFILPSRTPVGSGSISITRDGVTSASAAINVVASSFGTYAVNQRGTGPGVITGTDFRILSLASPARAGQTVIVWGTGLGAVGGDEINAPAPQTDLTNIPVSIYIGGRPATVVYRGRSSCCTGLDVIYVTVPAGVENCNVPVTVVANGISSNTTNIPIGPAGGGACSNTNGLGADDIQRLLTRNAISYGATYLSSVVRTTPQHGSIPAGVARRDLATAFFGRLTRPAFELNIEDVSPLPYGSCQVYQAGGGATGTSPYTPLNAGPAVTVAGPNGSRDMARTAEGTYTPAVSESISSPFIPPAGGTFTFTNGSGGPDIGSIGNVALTLPSDFVWTNAGQLPISVPRNQGLTVTWSGGGPNSFVSISGYSIVDGSAGVVGSFLCTERASAGTFTIPAYILSHLPASRATGAGVTDFLLGSLTVTASGQPTRFNASGLDFGFGWWHLSSERLLNFN